MGFADSPATRNALANHGIRVSGYRWRWALGLKGGTFPPHRHLNGRVGANENSFEGRTPGEDVNGSHCMCRLVPNYRTADGRLARPGLAPVFQAPVTAALPAPASTFDLTGLVDAFEAFAQAQVLQVNVRIPDGAIVVNVPAHESVAPVVNVAAPEVSVNVAPSSPTPVEVHAPITVEPTVVNVEPTPVKVENKITVPNKIRRVFRKIVRDADGTIVGVEDEVAE